MSAETVRQRFRQRLYAFRVQEETLQVEPDLAVMARLEDEMPFPLRKELRDLLFHSPAVEHQRSAASAAGPLKRFVRPHHGLLAPLLRNAGEKVPGRKEKNQDPDSHARE